MGEPFLQEPMNQSASPFADQSYTLPTPKTGGSQTGLNETLKFDNVRGACNVVLPISVTPGRRNFEPRLSLVYDSTVGNGPFGIGWTLDMPKIVRKSSHRVPKYDDSDIFLLIEEKNTFELVPDQSTSIRTLADNEYEVQQFIPIFTNNPFRLERWTSQSDVHNVYWKHISAENVTTFYGVSRTSRVQDERAGKIFGWLADQRMDFYGNAMKFCYRLEDDVDDNDKNPHQSIAQYVERIQYGNIEPHHYGMIGQSMAFHFEVFFNYSSHSAVDAALLLQKHGNPNDQWLCRPDKFSTFRSGIEIRTRRLCRNILMLHYFENEPSMKKYENTSESLIRSFTLEYFESPKGSQIKKFVETGHDGLDMEKRPPTEFNYNVSELVPDIPVEILSSVPSYQPFDELKWVNMDGTCLPSLVGKSSNGYFMRENLSVSCNEPVLADWVKLEQWPSLKQAKLMDFDNDGRVEYVNYRQGFYRKHGLHWSSFHQFTQVPNQDVSSNRSRVIDLTGTGTADILVADKEAYIWYESLHDDGFKGPKGVRFLDSSTELRPTIEPTRLNESIYLADMTGDGLLDVVRIRNGSICYWPNRGHGAFGKIISMEKCPTFESDISFSHSRLYLHDLDGSGPADIIYMPSIGGLQVYLNESGNSWADPVLLPHLGNKHDIHGSIHLVDLLGQGSACVVFHNKSLDEILYLNLFGSRKPRILSSFTNGFGMKTTFEYTSTAQLQKRDELRRQPWKLSVPVPIPCLTKVEMHDTIQESTTIKLFGYRDGFYDNQRREFNGFGEIEEWDGPEGASTTLHTKSHHFTGSVDQYSKYLSQKNSQSILISSPLSGSNFRKALRAAKGSLIQKLTINGPGEGNLVQSENREYSVQLDEEKKGQGMFRVLEIKRITSIHECEDHPRIHLRYASKHDAYGNALQWFDIYFGAVSANSSGQEKTKIIQTDRLFTDPVELADDFRAPVECQKKQSGKYLQIAHQPTTAISISQLQSLATDMLLINLSRRLFRSDDLRTTLPLCQVGKLGVESYETKLAFDHRDIRHLSQGLGDSLASDLERSGYIKREDGLWYADSGRWFFDQHFESDEELEAARRNFFTPILHLDQFGNRQALLYDRYWIAKTGLNLPCGIGLTAKYDYRTLSMSQLIDKVGATWSYEYDLLGNLLREYEGDTVSSGRNRLSPTLDGASIPGRVDELLRGSVTYTAQDFKSQPCRSILVTKWKGSTAIMISYYDGSGQIIQEKHLLKTGCWLVKSTKIVTVNGHIQHDYDPHYTQSPEFNLPSVEVKCSTTIYDCLHRPAIKVRQDGSWSQVDYKAWSQEHLDVGSTTATSAPGRFHDILAQSGRSLRFSAESHDLVYAGSKKVVFLDSEGRELEQAIYFEAGKRISNRKLYSITGLCEQVMNSKDECANMYTYNKLGDVIHTLNADTGNQYILRSIDGLITRLTKGAIRNATFLFDQLRRPTDDLEKGEVVVSRLYYEQKDVANNFTRLWRVKNETLTTTFLRYDIHGNPEEYNHKINLLALEGFSDILPLFKFEKEYEMDGRVLKTVFPDGRCVKNHYDTLGRLSEIENVTTIEYDAHNYISSLSYHNGYREDFEYNDNHWLQRRASTVHYQPIENSSYIRDVHGRIVEFENWAQIISQEPSERNTIGRHSYDGRGRLVASEARSKSTSTPGGVPLERSTFTSEFYNYDSENNVLSRNSLDNGKNLFYSYTYSGTSNKLKSIRVNDEVVQDLRFDGANGELGLPTQFNDFELQWNTEQRLFRVVSLGSASSFIYLYDSLGMRIAKVIGRSSHLQVHLKFEEFNAVFDLSEKGLTTMEESISMLIGERLLGRSHKQIGFITTITDELGSITHELNNSLQTIVYRTYSPYGEISSEVRWKQDSSDVLTSETTEKFTGKLHDSETDFYYSRNRYLASQLTRWLSPDPSGLAGGSTNLYCYADADPINNIDYDGLCPDKSASNYGYNHAIAPVKVALEQAALFAIFHKGPEKLVSLAMRGQRINNKYVQAAATLAAGYAVTTSVTKGYQYMGWSYNNTAETFAGIYGRMSTMYQQGGVQYAMDNIPGDVVNLVESRMTPKEEVPNSLSDRTGYSMSKMKDITLSGFPKDNPTTPKYMYSNALNRIVQGYLVQTQNQRNSHL